MDGGDLTVSATECARLTGISRERLRTWERRHGFPVPRRVASGPRRYELADIAALISVRRAVDGGIPVPEAIARVSDGARGIPEASALAEGLDAAPLPTLLIAGPQPAQRRVREPRSPQPA